MFVAIKHVFCLDKSIHGATKLLSEQNYVFVAKKYFYRNKQNFCREKHTLVATKDVFCRYKHEIVATKMILMAAPANDRDGVLVAVFVNGSLC